MEIHGVLNSETYFRGINKTPFKTSYVYDNWGQLSETRYPTGIRKAQVMQWATTGSIPGAKYNSFTQTSGSAPVTVWYDVLGRELAKETYGLNSKKVTVFTEYYPDGKKKRVSDPTFNSTSDTWAAVYTYDPYGRPATATSSMGITTNSYSGRNTSVSTPESTQQKALNTSGQTLTNTVNGKAVTYAYYPSGLTKTSTPDGGQAITMEYDLQGKRTKLIDPDGGTVESKYNGFGEILWEKQKIHNATDYVTTTNNYDDAGLGLLQSINRNGEITNYTYDPQYTNRVNAIEIEGKNKQVFTFDAFDRVTNVQETIDTQVYNTSKVFDALGRVKREIYPSGYYTVNTYDSIGNLMEVKDNINRSIWLAIDENAKGQLLHASKGGKVSTYDFDTRGFPTGISADGVMKAAYSFDAKGNLAYRTDELDPSNIQKEVFHDYDIHNRLTNWDIYKNGVLVKPNSITYDAATSNITAKSDLGPYTLTYGGQQANGFPIGPHALSAISGVPASFPQTEPNYPTALLNVTYTDFKKIATLSEKNKYYTLMYGVDDQRRMSVSSEGGVTKLTRYYLGDYEEEVDSLGKVRKIHYLSGAILIQNDGQPDSLLYTYSDFQGSLIVLTDASGNLLTKTINGAVVEIGRFAYDPWGARRNPTDWTQKDLRTKWITNRGYTGHEHLDAFGIINMNGRVYDPLTAMFFSPDPYVQAPGNWLNYNRYGYAFGNPFKYNDPNGEYFLSIICALVPGLQPLLPGAIYVDAALWGGTLNVASHWSDINKNGFDSGKFWSYAGLGVANGLGAASGNMWVIGATGAIQAGGNKFIGNDFEYNDQVLKDAAFGGITSFAFAGLTGSTNPETNFATKGWNIEGKLSTSLVKAGFSSTTSSYISNGLITFGYTYTTEAFYDKYVTDDPNLNANWSGEALKMAGLTTVFQIGAMAAENTSYDIIKEALNKTQKWDISINKMYNYKNSGKIRESGLETPTFQYSPTYNYTPSSTINLNFDLYNPRVIQIYKRNK